MRISMVTDWFHPKVGGIEVHVAGLARRLTERGHEVRVLTPWPGDDEVDGIPVVRLPVKLVPGLEVSLWPPSLARALDAALDAHPTDVIHGHVSFASIATMVAGHVGWRRKIPMLATYHSVFRKLGWAYVLGAPVVRWRRWPFRATAVSEAVARDLRWIMPERDVEILPNAIDPDAWPHQAPPPVAGRLRLVTIARLQRRKRVDALLRIVGQVRQAVGPAVDVSLEVMGTGPDEAALVSRARALGLADVVTFLGSGDAQAVKALLARSDVFVNAADQESFGIAALEASSTGLPVVARAEGGTGTFVRDGVNGLLVSSDEAMARALIRVAVEPNLLEALRTGAAGGVPPAFTWDRLVDRHEALYQEVVATAAVR